jgi:hypothetical protein
MQISRPGETQEQSLDYRDFEERYQTGSSHTSSTPPSMESYFQPAADLLFESFTPFPLGGYGVFEPNYSSLHEVTHSPLQNIEAFAEPTWDSMNVGPGENVLQVSDYHYHLDSIIGPNLTSEYSQNMHQLHSSRPKSLSNNFIQLSSLSLEKRETQRDPELQSDVHFDQDLAVRAQNPSTTFSSSHTHGPFISLAPSAYCDTSKAPAANTRSKAINAAKKTPLQKHIHVFDRHSGSPSMTKPRKKFTAQGKEDFKKTREDGACHPCRVLKRKVSHFET